MTGKYLCKIGRRIQAWIENDTHGKWWVHTGKPSDWTCIGWGPFESQDKAFEVARKFMDGLCFFPVGTTYKIVEG